ncbi:MAG: glycosyltransferase family 9 protein [Desulfobacterales bacterium]|nr:glycosyltransferase family 9 protein [Desulfobacterales bacterium]
MRIDDTKPQKILIILLSEIGSLILAQPMFNRIKEKYPHSTMQIMLFKKNKEILELLNIVPLDNIITINNSSLALFLKDSLSALKKMRETKFDIIIDCELFSRISSIFSFLSNAKICVGFHPHTQEGLYRGNFINRPVLYNPYQHIAKQFITLVEAISSTTIPKAKRNVESDMVKISPIKFKKNEINELLSIFMKDFPSVAGKKLVLINPSGGLLPIRAWPLEYYCRLTKKIIEHGYAVGIIGMGSDKELTGKIVAYCNSDACVDLTSYTKSIRELMMIFHFASLLITNDGGPGHFASLTPIYTIVFYGPETPQLYGTLNDNTVNFYRPLSCSPCLTAYNHRTSPCDGNNICLKDIRPEEVFKKIQEILKH